MTPATPLRSIALACALATSLVGCVLLVSPKRFGEHCRFDGEETPCGQCIRTRCEADVDGCCSAGACDATFSALETCTAGDVTKCDAVAALRTSTETATAALGRCLDERCRSECSAPSARSKTKCVASSFGQGQTCSCTLSTTPNDAACGEATLPQAICCAPEGWPADGLRCSCRAPSCGASNDGCRCLLTDGPSEGDTCSAKTCCARNDVCSCSALACLAGERTVAKCSRDELACGPGFVRVTSCAVAATP